MTYRSASSRAAAFDQALAEAMAATVTDAIDTQDTPTADPPAGTPSPEGVAPDAVAAVTAVIDSISKPDDGDRVEQPKPYFESVWHTYPDGSGGWTSPEGKRQLEAQDAESQRQARLRRWQAVDPRERRT